MIVVTLVNRCHIWVWSGWQHATHNLPVSKQWQLLENTDIALISIMHHAHDVRDDCGACRNVPSMHITHTQKFTNTHHTLHPRKLNTMCNIKHTHQAQHIHINHISHNALITHICTHTRTPPHKHHTPLTPYTLHNVWHPFHTHKHITHTSRTSHTSHTRTAHSTIKHTTHIHLTHQTDMWFEWIECGEARRTLCTSHQL